MRHTMGAWIGLILAPSGKTESYERRIGNAHNFRLEHVLYCEFDNAPANFELRPTCRRSIRIRAIGSG
jgi:hypothetical protein